MRQNYILQLRNKNGFTQEYVAKELGISRPTYIQLERGERELTVSEATKLAALFSLTLTDFLNENPTSYEVEITETKTNLSPKTNEVRISIPQANVDKFKEVFLYILKKAGGKPNVGMTVLYKILYFIDFDYYEKYEEQLMGLVYKKNHYGPTPALFDTVIADMIKENKIEAVKSKYYQHEQMKYFINPKIEPKLNILTGQELEHIDWELKRLSDQSAVYLSNLSHKDVPWISAEIGKPLDYEAVFYRTADTSVREYSSDERSEV